MRQEKTLMFDFDKHLAALADQTVLCIGDLMLDEFVYGEVARISPEAPAPVLTVKRSEQMIGGAGNVARNLVALGARCIFIGVVGDDDAGRTLADALGEDPLIEFHLVVDGARQTTRKVRFVSEHHSTHLMRADWETTVPTSAHSEASIIAYAETAMPQVGAVVLSDYAKGTLTPRVTRAIIDAARGCGKPVVVDPKGHDYSVYRGATLITPNRQELGAAVHRPVATEAEIGEAAAELARLVASEAVLVTRSEQGMTLHIEGHGPIHIPAYPVKVHDVSGAGDTVAAVMAVLLAMRAPFESAMRAANAAAAVVVGKRGTATVSLAELRHRVLPSASLAPEDKIVFDWSVLDERLADWRKHDRRSGSPTTSEKLRIGQIETRQVGRVIYFNTPVSIGIKEHLEVIVYTNLETYRNLSDVNVARIPIEIAVGNTEGKLAAAQSLTVVNCK